MLFGTASPGGTTDFVAADFNPLIGMKINNVYYFEG
jgi:hypothetical protein